MGGMHRSRSACGTQDESRILTCQLRLVNHVWTKGFLSASMEQGRRWAEGIERGLHAERRPKAAFSHVISVLSLMSGQRDSYPRVWNKGGDGRKAWSAACT